MRFCWYLWLLLCLCVPTPQFSDIPEAPASTTVFAHRTNHSKVPLWHLDVVARNIHITHTYTHGTAHQSSMFHSYFILNRIKPPDCHYTLHSHNVIHFMLGHGERLPLRSLYSELKLCALGWIYIQTFSLSSQDCECIGPTPGDI